MSTIRLACAHCDRNDCDFITPEELETAKAAGWTHIDEVQTYEESIRTYDDPADAPPGFDSMAWWTMLGVCPDCRTHGD